MIFNVNNLVFGLIETSAIICFVRRDANFTGDRRMLTDLLGAAKHVQVDPTSDIPYEKPDKLTHSDIPVCMVLKINKRKI